MTGWLVWAERELDAIRSADRWRAPRTFDAIGPRGLLDGRVVVSYASNDYLGLSAHPAVAQAARAAIERWGTGSTASRLIVGDRPCHQELERELAVWKDADRAVVFPSGFAANLGVVSVLGGRDVTVLSDELNHASIIDGCRLSRSTVRVYRHCDIDHVASILDATSGRCIVVSDAVFSMDGDVAPVDDLAQLCAARGALLVLDEAHSVLGASIPATNGDHVVRVGTLSKALGSLGGFVVGPGAIIDLLINRARSFIFTTALSPADTAAALAALRILTSTDGERRVRRLRSLVDSVRPDHPSPIIPIVLGDEAVALEASRSLLDRGIFIPAVRPPTVPAGTSRLRIAISIAHSDDMIGELTSALADLGLAVA